MDPGFITLMRKLAPDLIDEITRRALILERIAALQPVGRRQLAARLKAFIQNGVQRCPGGVDGRCIAGGTASDDQAFGRIVFHNHGIVSTCKVKKLF